MSVDVLDPYCCPPSPALDLSFFEQFIPLGQKMASRFARMYEIENRMDELMSEVHWTLLQAPLHYRESFQEKQIKKCTFIYMYLHWKLLDFCRKEVSHKPKTQGLTEKIDEICPLDFLPKKETWKQKLQREISEEGQALVNIILDCPEDLRIICPKQEHTRLRMKELICSYLIDVLDWDHYATNMAWEEVKSCLLAPG